MIECLGVTARAGNFMLRDISFTVPAGAHAVLVGPTASGKSTLLELIAGAMSPTAGAILISGQDVTHTPAESRGVGLVPQHGYLFPHLDVARNVMYGAQDANAAHAALAVVRRFGVDHLMDRSVTSLSGGERQLVALCRALGPSPAVLLMDEPLSALDPKRRNAALRALEEWQAERSLTMLHVTHQETDTAHATMQLAMLDGMVSAA